LLTFVQASELLLQMLRTIERDSGFAPDAALVATQAIECSRADCGVSGARFAMECCRRQKRTNASDDVLGISPAVY
jgi:hypothetical protein